MDLMTQRMIQVGEDRYMFKNGTKVYSKSELKELFKKNNEEIEAVNEESTDKPKTKRTKKGDTRTKHTED